MSGRSGWGEGGVSRALRKMDLYRLRTNRTLETVCEKYLQGIFLFTGSSPDKKMYYITYMDCTPLVSLGLLVRALRNKRPSRRSFRLTSLETLRAWELAGAYNLGPATSILTIYF